MKSGAGTLTVTGANTYTGGTTVNAGTLQGNTTSLRNTIVNNAAVVFNQTAAGTYAGAMSGSGSLTKIGAGTLTVSGANTYSGGTTVAAGVLSGTSTSLQGSIVNNATVNFNQAVAGTYAGAMSGAGVLTKSGAGTLILTGVNSYAGGTSVTAGTLQGSTTSLQGNIASSSAVVFDQVASGTYAGVLAGTGSLTKTSAGTLTLTGANTYSGGTRFNGGTVAVASDSRLGTGALTFNGGALQTLAAFSSSQSGESVGRWHDRHQWLRRQSLRRDHRRRLAGKERRRNIDCHRRQHLQRRHDGECRRHCKATRRACRTPSSTTPPSFSIRRRPAPMQARCRVPAH